MKKITLKMALIAMALVANFAVKAQVEFNHSAGLGFYASETSSGYALKYSPRLNLLEMSDEMSLSIGSHLGVGFSGTSNSQTGTSGSFILDLPLMAEVNFGHASSTNSSVGFGGFLGAGFGYHKAAYEDGIFSGNRSATGLVFNGGIRTNLIKETSITFRVSYMLASDGNGDIIGVGLLYNLGDY